MIWVVPGVLAVVVLVPVLVALRRAAGEARLLRDEIRSLATVAEPVGELRREVSALRAAVPPLAIRTRPVQVPAS